MKRLIMCEGPNELGIMRILLDNDKLIFGEDDLIGLEPYHARQIVSNGQVRTQLNMYPGNDVIVMRVGDVQNEMQLNCALILLCSRIFAGADPGVLFKSA